MTLASGGLVQPAGNGDEVPLLLSGCDYVILKALVPKLLSDVQAQDDQ